MVKCGKTQKSAHPPFSRPVRSPPMGDLLLDYGTANSTNIAALQLSMAKLLYFQTTTTHDVAFAINIHLPPVLSRTRNPFDTVTVLQTGTNRKAFIQRILQLYYSCNNSITHLTFDLISHQTIGYLTTSKPSYHCCSCGRCHSPITLSLPVHVCTNHWHVMTTDTNFTFQFLLFLFLLRKVGK